MVTDDTDHDISTAYWQSSSNDEVAWLCVTHTCLCNQPITTEYCTLQAMDNQSLTGDYIVRQTASYYIIKFVPFFHSMIDITG